MILSDAAIKNRVTVAMLVLLILIMGAYSYMVLPRESFPEVPVPVVMITTVYDGVSPEDIESSVTMKIEKEMTGIRGMKEITSVSAEGMSTISRERGTRVGDGNGGGHLDHLQHDHVGAPICFAAWNLGSTRLLDGEFWIVCIRSDERKNSQADATRIHCRRIRAPAVR